QGQGRGVVEARGGCGTRPREERRLARGGEDGGRGRSAGAAADDADVELGQVAGAEDVVVGLASFHSQQAPFENSPAVARIEFWMNWPSGVSGRGPATSSGLGVDMGWSGRST